MPTRTSIIGRTFGSAIVTAAALDCVSPAGSISRRSVLLCKCGKTFVARNADLIAGKTQSCGCLRSAVVSAARLKHGHAGNAGKGRPQSRTYRSWADMLLRCYNPKNKCFAVYGGAGITVCERWRVSFDNFLCDMGECPPRLTIDRWPNNAGNYEPGNCRWATRKQQANNRRPRKHV